MKLIKILFIWIFVGLVGLLGYATFVEQTHGPLFVAESIYHTWWFFALWACLAVLSVIIITQQKLWKHTAVFMLSRLMLYPAVFFLAAGIFLGAVWANVSWGKYWSWDPKEVWALITMMIYAVPIHHESLHFLRQPKWFHLYLILAFFTVLMTYFGVNYFLGGMHSYA